MIDTPTPYPDVPVIFDPNAVEYTSVDESQSANRVSICKTCSKFMMIGNATRCLETGNDINLMITANELSCPLEKW
jgi:hypothetical protein